MSQKNDEMSGAVFAVAFIGVAVLAMAFIIYAVAVFAALVLSVLCIIAWDRKRRLELGPLVVEPEEARWFIIRGIAGAAFLPVFVAFICLLSGTQIESGWWVHIVLAGYAAGSVGIECLLEQEAARSHGNAPVPPPAPIAPHRPALPPQPFRFASWDDEDSLP